jgi:serine/threonine protein kinase
MIEPQTLLQNRYLVIRQIGQGGMGAVYIATDQRFGSTVALKETFFTDVSLRKAFEREAILLNRLRHPALPRVSDHFLEDEGQFLVMEFIPGDDLSEMLKQQGGAFPLKEVLGWADQLLDALDYLHTQEPPVIHRDIKPQNLKLTSRGQIILLDFGLAKGTPSQVSKITQSRSVFGYSRNYAPIEQIQGTGTDPRSDLYSLAATLYHLMSGFTPPDALTRATDVLNGQSDPLRPGNEVHSQITPTVAQVLMRAMSQNAGHRPQSAAAMREELREAGKETIVGGNVTSRDALAVNTLLEQDTQLIGTQGTEKKTAIDVENAKQDSIPVVQLATSANAGVSTEVEEHEQQNGTWKEESEITAVKKTTASTRSFSGRTIGIAAGIIVLALLSVVVYAMTRRSQTPTLTNQTNTPSTNNSQAGQPEASPNSNSEKTVPQNSQGGPTPSPDALRNASRPVNAQVAPRNLPAASDTPAPPKHETQAGTKKAGNNTAATDENAGKQQAAEEVRQARMERRRAAIERQRAMYQRRQAEMRDRRARARRP